ncbi:dTDP-4-dehydrorhamnose 3,5-epimerase [Neobacillus terrae]|uniref:dTDP-4-dehydrorhamnose 3,5-epimerase n=1 Tax=Neobacillus terrae TaxID=3034837 RepID=UPI00140CBDD3|nr:dTDP-4-dehydrorhamnose 3,5-epimerase [Neobacillus terrae]NHM31126.1 dTDP-4-dehydrorhamnose 3,5-epimerase [Neobacillus terrae]
MFTNYKFLPTNIEGLMLIEPFTVYDERGFMKKTFEKNIFLEKGIDFSPIEEIETTSKKGVLRGLHYQNNNSQAKLIRCSKGKILDVAVDLRKSSSTFGNHFSVMLSSENKRMLYIPRGFAHGCLSLEDDTTFYYLCDNKYSPEHDSGILWNDEDLAIDWGKVAINQIILSEKDKKLQTFQEFKTLHCDF